ncbi:MAG: hypothetical protein AAF297_01420 [Planctomycetota bacterium]
MTSVPPTGSPTIPFALAKAYGVKTVKPLAPTGPAFETKPTAQIASTSTAKPIADVLDVLTSKQVTAKIGALIAAKVDKPAFESVRPVTAAAEALPFYRRPTDAIDAATEIALGRALDTQG